MAAKAKRSESRCRYYVRAEAERKDWNLDHVKKGGDILEEQEIEDTFPDIGLEGDRPDFIFCVSSNPIIVVEAKNESGKLDVAVSQAIDYANQINEVGKYLISFAIGAAGEKDTGFEVSIMYLYKDKWVPLTSHGFELTSIPSKKEIELALEANDGSTTITIPSSAEFVDSAIEISHILRVAKVEPPLRPKVIGAIVLAMYQGQIEIYSDEVLESINNLVGDAITEAKDLNEKRKSDLLDALHLSGTDFNRLSPYIGRVVNILRRLNVRSVIHTDADFLGMFYEAFLRYGYDSKSSVLSLLQDI